MKMHLIDGIGTKLPTFPPAGEKAKILDALGAIERSGNVEAGLSNLTALEARYRLGARWDSSAENRQYYERAADAVAGIIAGLEQVAA